MKSKQKKFWWIDITLFAGFLAAFFLNFTGVELHQWVGVLGGLLAAYHLLVHWDWVEAVSQRFAQKAPGIVRVKFVVDGMILVGFMLIIFTGLVISTWLDIPLGSYTGWLSVHIVASITTLLALMLKLALHWRWITKATRELLLASAAASTRRTALQPVPASGQNIPRRDFLKVMGVAGGASLVALLSATRSLAALQDTEDNISNQAGEGETVSTFFSQRGSAESAQLFSVGGSCSIQCGKRCSYPGHCRRYTDSNNNNICDFGECA